MVGFLLALNAMLLTVPERRRFVADLRMQGYDWRQIVALLGFQAAVLGVAASAVGVLLGDLLSRAFLHRIPTYLTTAFPIGTHESLHVGTSLLAVGCGVLATMLASLSPALDLRPSRPTDAIFRDRSGGSEVLAPGTPRRLLIVAAVSLVAITVLVLLAPGLTVLGGVALALTTLCVIPRAVRSGGARALQWAGERVAQQLADRGRLRAARDHHALGRARGHRRPGGVRQRRHRRGAGGPAAWPGRGLHAVPADRRRCG